MSTFIVEPCIRLGCNENPSAGCYRTDCPTKYEKELPMADLTTHNEIDEYEDRWVVRSVSPGQADVNPVTLMKDDPDSQARLDALKQAPVEGATPGDNLTPEQAAESGGGVDNMDPAVVDGKSAEDRAHEKAQEAATAAEEGLSVSDTGHGSKAATGHDSASHGKSNTGSVNPDDHTKEELQDMARDRGLPTSGTKEEIADRLNES